MLVWRIDINDINDLITLLRLFELWIRYRAFTDVHGKRKSKAPHTWMHDYLTKRPTLNQTMTLMPLLLDQMALASQRKLLQNTWEVDVQMFDYLLRRRNSNFVSKSSIS